MSRWKTALGATVGLCATLAVVEAQQKTAGKAANLTPLDIIEIQQLAIRYAYGLDTAADEGHLYSDVFTPDGEFVSGIEIIKGREALARFGRRTRKPDVGISQFLMNQVVAPSPEGATG